MHERNKSGQALGQKGLNTRVRIIDATRELLDDSRGIAPTAASIARKAGVSPPTFYLYFADVGEAIIAIVEELDDDLEAVLDHLRTDWPRDRLFESASTFVSIYFAYWSRHASALRVRNRLADQGDPAFVRLRVDSAVELGKLLAQKVALPTIDGAVVGDAQSLAVVFLTALERSATVSLLDLYPGESRQVERRITALAILFVKVMTN